MLRERLEVEFAMLRDDRWNAAAVDYLVRRLPAAWVQERIEDALELAEAEAAKHPRPEVLRREGEPADEHLARVQEATAKWRRRLRTATMRDFREAFLLAEALCRSAPTVARLRQKARAARRGLGDVERAGHFESQALFLETLDALARANDVTARRAFRRGAARVSGPRRRARGRDRAARMGGGKSGRGFPRAQAVRGPAAAA